MMAVALTHTDIGSGPLGIVLHGLFGRRRNWLQIQRSIASQVRLMATDLRNHGESPWATPMTYHAMADDIAALIDTLPTAPPLIGHSMGGKAAMTFALREPDRVKALMVIDIAPVSYTHDYRPYIKVMRDVPLSSLRRRNDAEDYLAEGVPDPMVRAFLLQNLAQEDGSYKWQVNLDAIEAGMDDILGFDAPKGQTYEGPCVFLAGEQSDYIESDGKKRIAELFPNARHFTIKGAGHWVHADQPNAVASAIASFVTAYG